LARETPSSKSRWLRAFDAFLSATLARAKYLRASGRLVDPESATDIAALEAEHLWIRRRLDRLRSEQPPAAVLVRLPDDAAGQLSLATRRQLRRYRDAVCEDARQLRARSAALRLRSGAARHLRLLDGGASSSRPRAG
jgi:hypothetical protein